MGIFEAIMIIYIPAGTIILNRWRAKLTNERKWPRIAYSLSSVAMAAAPALYARSLEPDYTAFAVVLVGIALFWFAIMGARVANT